jgi:hypothetical protein
MSILYVVFPLPDIGNRSELIHMAFPLNNYTSVTSDLQTSIYFQIPL